MLIVDGDCVSNHRVWSETITVATNRTYNFSAWTSANSNDSGDPQYFPLLRVQINGVNVIQNFSVPYTSCNGWIQFSTSWFSGSSTSATIEIYDDNLKYRWKRF